MIADRLEMIDDPLPVLFEVRLVSDGLSITIDYTSCPEAIRSKTLRRLFESGSVTKCELFVDGERLTGLGIPTWEGFVQIILDNAQDLLKGSVL